MGTISIHGLDDDLERRLREMAQEKHQSLNRTVKDVIAGAIGRTSRSAMMHDHFARFLGSWSAQDLEEFSTAVQEFGQIDPRDWS